MPFKWFTDMNENSEAKTYEDWFLVKSTRKIPTVLLPALKQFSWGVVKPNSIAYFHTDLREQKSFAQKQNAFKVRNSISGGF